VLYPEEMCKSDENQPVEEDDEEEEEEEEVGINVGEILDQPMNAGEVLSTHHIVYGEDGQVINTIRFDHAIYRKKIHSPVIFLI